VPFERVGNEGLTVAIPTQIEVEIPLLEEIEKAGGTVKPRDILPLLTKRFPNITPMDLEKTLPGGNKKWYNWVHWTRQALVSKGELDSTTRGVWAITDKGRRRVHAWRAKPPQGPRVPPSLAKKRSTRQRALAVNHDDIARALDKIGRAFGFESRWKPTVNQIRPDKRAFKSKRKTLDVGWRIANLTWVPIEVQVGGSVPDLIYRFQQVHQWSVRLIVVTVEAFADEIREAVHDYPFRDKIVVLQPEEVLAATRSIEQLLSLKEAIFA